MEPAKARTAGFEKRAATYDRDAWHVRYAERLVEVAGLEPGMRVLDAATGTGHAAFAAARVVGDAGRIVGVDLSPAMLTRARAAGVPNVEFVESDTSSLPALADGSFDRVLCSAGLLYLPVDTALREWHRLLAPAGVVAFSTMRRGHPFAARLFRDLGRTYGLALPDPAERLGTVERCADALSEAGFEPLEPVVETVRFDAYDLTRAWDVHVDGPHRDAMASLTDAQRTTFQRDYGNALADHLAGNEAEVLDAGVIYARGTR
ncbi:class I SAM-dependent methyltransferase [Tenggerimyces flavus]|uniref:Class I SAM-dependent methyltransferase n=1 Tax=Tenggerimyces flavus TaxID=1708749 RepID=A0ABV7YEB2_9ACTN|nr:methyltransferase domain-containing protein [Tenggerimyces flavus]MBM7784310.1 ubiquinone/menaquinone biosynthesis C-methylase UbiE [Tenggerimyces flavus]